MSIFVLSLVPAALAESGKGKDGDEQWLDTKSKIEAKAVETIRETIPRPEQVVGGDPSQVAELAPFYASGSSGEGKHITLKNIIDIREKEKELKKIRLDYDIKKLIKELQEQDEQSFNQGKGFLVTQYVVLVIQRLQFKIGAMLEKIGSDETFEKEHAAAVQALRDMQGKLDEYRVRLTAVLKDNRLTREEWTGTVVPVMQGVRRIVTDLREKHRGFFNEWRKNHAKKTAQEIILKLREKREKIELKLRERLKSEAEVKSRMKVIDSQMAVIADAAAGTDGAEEMEESFFKIKSALDTSNELKAGEYEVETETETEVEEGEVNVQTKSKTKTGMTY